MIIVLSTSLSQVLNNTRWLRFMVANHGSRGRLESPPSASSRNCKNYRNVSKVQDKWGKPLISLGISRCPQKMWINVWKRAS
jgi:hypothetical protein